MNRIHKRYVVVGKSGDLVSKIVVTKGELQRKRSSYKGSEIAEVYVMSDIMDALFGTQFKDSEDPEGTIIENEQDGVSSQFKEFIQYMVEYHVSKQLHGHSHTMEKVLAELFPDLEGDVVGEIMKRMAEIGPSPCDHGE